MIHLDSNIIVAHLRGHERVARHLEAALPDVAVSTVVLGELIYGARISRRPRENLEQLDEFLELIQLVSFDRNCADIYGSIRAAQRRAGRPTGETDALIAATALAYGATLITHNTRHFQEVDGLTLEDWLA